jgi:hypothetical protein
MKIESVTVKAMGGLQTRVSKGFFGGGLVATVFKKGRDFKYTDIVTFVADEKDRPRVIRDQRGICQLLVNGFHLDLSDVSARSVAQFLGIEYPSKNEAMP